MTRGRLAVVGAVLVLAGLAVQGGEFSTLDWLTLRRQVATERAAVDSLTRRLDSLRRRAKAIETDTVEQERLARERWGYVRPGETLFRLVRPGEGEAR